MGMVVRTNINALNAHRNLGKNNKSNASALEKLSSGFRINRAGDDASGLAISEKMKAQIKALGTASDNCEDGISLVQTAEGYMSEVHDMLNRMVELAEKAANGIMEKGIEGKTGANAYGASTDGLHAGTDRTALQAEMDQLCAEIDRIAITANFNGNKILNGALDEKATRVVGEDGKTVTSITKAAMKFQIGETSNDADKLHLNIKSVATDSLFKELKNKNLTKENNGSGVVDWTQTVTQGTASANESGLTINISYQDYASQAAEKIRDVIDDVSLQRAQLGAAQNRLDYTINNLNTTEENMNAANSRIRDTDMAEEMMKFTQTNVLTQAAQAMLAQANTQPQNVLSLLQ